MNNKKERRKVNISRLSYFPIILFFIIYILGYIDFDDLWGDSLVLEFLFVSFSIWSYVSIVTGVSRDKLFFKVYRKEDPVSYWFYLSALLFSAFFSFVAVLIKWSS